MLTGKKTYLTIVALVVNALLGLHGTVVSPEAAGILTVVFGILAAYFRSRAGKE